MQNLNELASLVRKRRKQLGFKQSELAQRAGTGTRFVVDLERGKPTLQIGKANDVLSVLGLQLRAAADPAVDVPAPLPAWRPRSLKEAVLLSQKNGHLGPYIREFLDEFYSEPDRAEKEEMLQPEPPLLDDEKSNAYLGAVAEHLALRNTLSIPGWALQPSRFLKQAYFPLGLESLKARLIAESPTAFRRRMIFVETDPLFRPRRDKVGIG